jgi:hypothetical protein
MATLLFSIGLIGGAPLHPGQALAGQVQSEKGNYRALLIDEKLTRLYVYISPVGPTTDRTGNANGFFIYVEMSSGSDLPLTMGSTASIETPLISHTAVKTNVCTLTFWYHFFGSSSGGLEFTTTLVGCSGSALSTSPLWTMPLTSSDAWVQVSVLLPSQINEDFNIRFRVIRGDTWQADIAMDDIKLSCVVRLTQSSTTLFVLSHIVLLSSSSFSLFHQAPPTTPAAQTTATTSTTMTSTTATTSSTMTSTGGATVVRHTISSLHQTPQ